MNRTRTRLLWTLTAVVLLCSRPCGAAGPSAGEPDSHGIEALLPDARIQGTLERSSEPLLFGRGNLWDYINGGADTYLQYGFRQLLVSDWTTADSTRVSAEIYEMESPDHAFGIFSAERSSDDAPMAVGVEGYAGSYFLNFWKGPYYVKLSAFRSSETAREALRILADGIAASIPGEFRPPDLLTDLPREDRTARSERFVPANFLGHPFLKNGCLADYRSGEDDYQVFLADIQSPAEAEEAFDEYRGFLKSAGEKVSLVRKSGYRMMRLTGGGTLVFQTGTCVGGILGLDDPEKAERIAEVMIENVQRRARSEE